MSSRTIAVVGATGAQGGGLMRAILSDPEGGFRARGITRNPDSDRARALAAEGAEMVQADLDDLESLVRAFDGCHGAFCVTNYWEHMSPMKELDQAENLAEAARRAGVSHVIWSTLEDTRRWVPLEDDRMPTLMDQYKVPHFDAKGEADRFFIARDLPVTFLVASYYWDNLIHFGAGPQRGEDGALVFTLPMGEKAMPGIAAEDIGKSAYGIFKAGEDLIGETVGIAGEHLTGAEMAAGIGRAVGEKVTHFSPSFDTYRSFGFPGADDLGNMFQFYHDFDDDVRGVRSVKRTRKLNPELMDFDAWLDRYGAQIPVG